ARLPPCGRPHHQGQAAALDGPTGTRRTRHTQTKPGAGRRDSSSGDARVAALAFHKTERWCVSVRYAPPLFTSLLLRLPRTGLRLWATTASPLGGRRRRPVHWPRPPPPASCTAPPRPP